MARLDIPEKYREAARKNREGAAASDAPTTEDGAAPLGTPTAAGSFERDSLALFGDALLDDEFGAVLPALEAAAAALDALTKSDLVELKAMCKPPRAVKLVMEAVCVALDIKPVNVAPRGAARVDDYWGPSKRALGDVALLRALKTLDKDRA